ncbi:OmpA-OmpF porin, OOP family [Monaibacterium marinum]|uniref:OmpA-OmpF porin, OOP family n=1 Tax=Pontivivens marinum TaxID=1690039 RepID=A0A2C9CN83_9RHOB|nr:OmpA family protein [Monaibacterium marinum]SOH92703.1 OmpA-OmpF porin, OOP family [Monaibacterium marinum]
MKVIAIIVALAGFGASGVGAWHLARIGADEFEGQTQRTVGTALSAAGQDWVTATADGFNVTLTGNAPSEAARFRALEVAEAVMRREHITDQIVLSDAAIAVPDPLSFDILLAPDLVTLLGSTPATLTDALPQMAEVFDRRVVDLTRVVETEPQADWQQTMALLGTIAPQIATGRIMVTDGTVSIEAALPDAEIRQQLLAEIAAATPAGQEMALSLSAPRMTLSPYPFDLSVQDGAFQLGACAAESEEDSNTITRQVAATSGQNDLECSVALGAPDADWTHTVQLSIEMLNELSDAAISIRDRVVALSIPDDLEQARLDTVTGQFETDLPDGYSLRVITITPEVAPDSIITPPRDMTLTIAPDRLSAVGAVTGEAGVETMLSYAESEFPGRELSLDLIADLPGTAPPLADALALVDVLAMLDTGTIRIDVGSVNITGRGAGNGLADNITAILEERLSGDRTIMVKVEEYELEQAATAVTLEVLHKTLAECQQQVTAVQAVDRIIFAPSSATLEIASAPPLDAIARILATCPDLNVTVEAYTDSSGGEEMNQTISQRRADSVLDALLARGVFLDRMTATGYGEASPIADNGTAEGREANRRIEFTLTEAPAADETTPVEEDEAQ